MSDINGVRLFAMHQLFAIHCTETDADWLGSIYVKYIGSQVGPDMNALSAPPTVTTTTALKNFQ